MRIAPDKNDPFPRPVQNGNGNGNNNGGGNGGGRGASFEPGAVNRYVDEQVAIHGGDPDKWRAHYKSIYSPVSLPDYSWEKRGGGNGNGKGDPTANPNPNVNGDGGGTPDPGYLFGGSRAAPMQAQPPGAPMGGFLNVGPAGQRLPPTLGLLGQPQPQQRQPVQSGFLPPEIQALLTQRR